MKRLEARDFYCRLVRRGFIQEFMSFKVLGISAFYHDSAAAVTEDGNIIAAAQEERFSRKKHDSSFPSGAVEFCLRYSGFRLSELDAVVFYDKPLLKFERLLETYYAFAPKGFKSFAAAVPVWVKEKLFIKNTLRKVLSAYLAPGEKFPEFLFTAHHLSHAASAFFPSPFEKAAILTVDGVGEWATSSISAGSGGNIKQLREMSFPNSVGLLYSAFTYYLGFKVNSGEYKLMGLAPYGNKPETAAYERLIYDNIVDVKDDGSVFLNQDYFKYCYGLRMTEDRKWESLFGFGPRSPESALEQKHCDLALAIQNITEDIIIKMAKETARLTKEENLCLAGGVALNCAANGKLLRTGMFKNIWVQPAAGDAGGALGAALAASYMYFGVKRPVEKGKDSMQGAYLGPEYSDIDIKLSARRNKAVYTFYSSAKEVCSKAASLIADGKVVGWFQGRMEWGPRALGNRSILGDARNPDMQKRLNLKIKHREGFRPFAPAVTEEDCAEYFDIDGPSPYMLFTAPVTEKRRIEVPQDFSSFSVKDKLYFRRSDIPAVTHIDYSARLQTVSRSSAPVFHALLSEFKKITGCPLTVNTSFNVRGEPIVCSPDDAYACFMRTDMDYLVMGNFIFDKREQKAGPFKAEYKGGDSLD